MKIKISYNFCVLYYWDGIEIIYNFIENTKQHFFSIINVIPNPLFALFCISIFFKVCLKICHHVTFHYVLLWTCVRKHCRWRVAHSPSTYSFFFVKYMTTTLNEYLLRMSKKKSNHLNTIKPIKSCSNGLIFMLDLQSSCLQTSELSQSTCHSKSIQPFWHF